MPWEREYSADWRSKMTREHCRVFQWRKFFLIHVQVTLQVKDKRGNGSEQASAIDYTIAGHSVG